MKGLTRSTVSTRAAVAVLSLTMLFVAAGCGSDAGDEGASDTPAAAPQATTATPARDLPTPEPGKRDVVMEAPGGAEAKASIATGELPDGYPSDLPTPPDATPAQSMLIPGHGGLVTFTTDASPNDVRDHYRQALPGEGWNIAEDSAVAQRTTIRATKDDRTANVMITPGGQGSEVAIAIDGI